VRFDWFGSIDRRSNGGTKAKSVLRRKLAMKLAIKLAGSAGGFRCRSRGSAESSNKPIGRSISRARGIGNSPTASPGRGGPPRRRRLRPGHPRHGHRRPAPRAPGRVHLELRPGAERRQFAPSRRPRDRRGARGSPGSESESESAAESESGSGKESPGSSSPALAGTGPRGCLLHGGAHQPGAPRRWPAPDLPGTAPSHGIIRAAGLATSSAPPSAAAGPGPPRPNADTPNPPPTRSNHGSRATSPFFTLLLTACARPHVCVCVCVCACVRLCVAGRRRKLATHWHRHVDALS
jgi:hypothetical protein